MIPRDRVFDKIGRLLFPLLLLLGNLFVALGTELAHDEAYYWLFSKHLAWGYFDHPPLTAWLIALTSWIPGELGVRLSFVLLMQGSGWLMSQLVSNEQKPLVWLGLITFPLLAFAGVFAIPDGPLVFMSAAWLWALARFLKDENWANSLLMGLVTALLLYAKYHGILFVAATVLALPRLLKSSKFWVAAIVGVLLFLPHVYWQWAHEFATFRYHFVDRPSAASGIRQKLEFILLQVFLPGVFLGPLMWWAFFKRKAVGEFERALKVIAIFIPVFFFISTFSKKVEGNWTVAAGLPLLIYVARGNLQWNAKRSWRIASYASILVVLLGRALLMVPPEWHNIKRAREFHGWKNWAQEVSALTQGCHLAANRYQIAAKLSFYLQKEVPALNVGTRLNQFEFWDFEKAWGQEPVCWITDRRMFPHTPVPNPDRKNLVLVRDIPLDAILSHKDRSL